MTPTTSGTTGKGWLELKRSVTAAFGPYHNTAWDALDSFDLNLKIKRSAVL